jgi:hypothetical protein
MEDDLKAEYNLKILRVRKSGSGRKMNKIAQASIIEEQNTQSFIPTDEHKNVYQKCREDLLKRQLSNTENFDRSILTLSSSTLGLTLTFIRNVTHIEEAHYIGLLLLSWGLLAAAIVVTLSSFLVSQAGTETQLIYAEEYYLNGRDEYGKKRNVFARINKILGYISAAIFVVAMILLVAFVWINITTGEKSMSNAKIDISQMSLSKNIDGANITHMISAPSESDELGKFGANIPAMQPISKPLASPSSSGTSGNGGSESGGQPTNESSGSKQ